MRNFLQLLFLSIFGAFLLTSCQEDEKPIDNSAQVVGYWRNTMVLDDDIQMIRYYSFSDNGKFQASTVYITADSQELLGYSGRSSGNYTLLDNQLATLATDVYTLPEFSDTPYVPNGSLIYVEGDISREIKVEFSEDKMTWIYPPCGPLENCIGSQEFEKYTPLEF